MRLLAPAERAEGRLARAQDVPGSSAAALDPEQHVGLELDCLSGPARPGVVAICAQRPLGRNTAVIKCGLAHEVDLHHAVDARDRAHERVVGILIGGGARGGGGGGSSLTAAAPAA